MRTRSDDINQLINIKLMSLNNTQPVRELALSERPVSWLVERHDNLSKQAEQLSKECLSVPLAIWADLESIEDELIDRQELGDLERLRRDSFAQELYERAQAIIQRGSNR